ncbi:MAG: tRNA 2-selenouridine(34) synthase MnmH [Sediminibacterium sp.]|nr:tRNA 2-selenouridine(34) synthase MnmH [Sediminibacterium sp.]
MAITKLSVEEFLALAKEHPVLDVRSPGEFSHAQIPGAKSLPLFTDEERKVVGTAYKQESQQKAIKFGLGYFGAKMVKMVEEVEEIIKSTKYKVQSTKYEVQSTETNALRTSHLVPHSSIILVHCWRGGMRSAGVAWMLDLYGYKVYTLVGGYKAYRKWVLQQFEKDYPLQILGGYTGSGKTEVLHALAQKKHCVIDLEALASHKGSAFGNLGLPKQPSQEMFENTLARDLAIAMAQCKLAALNGQAEQLPIIWMEDESQRIGQVNIPTVLFQQMRMKKLFFLDIPFAERLNFIADNYGRFEKEKLVNAIIRIKKRLGGLETKTAINHLLEDDVKACFVVLLNYYDKLYLKSLQTNRPDFSLLFNKLELEKISPEETAAQLISMAQEATV